MKMNMDALKALELKLAEYSKANGSIAEHESANTNCPGTCGVTCSGHCSGGCTTACGVTCSGGCTNGCTAACGSTCSGGKK